MSEFQMQNRRLAIAIAIAFAVLAQLPFSTSFAAADLIDLPKPGAADASARTQWARDKGGVAERRRKIESMLARNEAGYVDMHFELKGQDVEEPAKLERTSLYAQFAYVMSGPAQPEYFSPSGYRVLAYIEPHNPSVRAMIMTNGAGSTIIVLGMLHRFCGCLNAEKSAMVKFARNPCEENPTLSILYPKGTERNRTLEQELVSYTKALLENGEGGMIFGATNELKIQIRQLN